MNFLPDKKPYLSKINNVLFFLLSLALIYPRLTYSQWQTYSNFTSEGETISFCLANTNKDQKVDAADAVTVLEKFNQSCQGCAEDVNQDKRVNAADFVPVLQSFGKSLKSGTWENTCSSLVDQEPSLGVGPAGLEGNIFTVDVPSDQAVVIDNNTIARRNTSTSQVEICHLGNRGSWICDLSSSSLLGPEEALRAINGSGYKGVTYRNDSAYPVAFGPWGEKQLSSIGGGPTAAADPATGKLVMAYGDGANIDIWVEGGTMTDPGNSYNALEIPHGYGSGVVGFGQAQIGFDSSGNAYLGLQYKDLSLFPMGTAYLEVWYHKSGNPWANNPPCIGGTEEELTCTLSTDSWVRKIRININLSGNVEGIAVDKNNRLVVARPPFYYIYDIPSFSLFQGPEPGIYRGQHLISPDGNSIAFRDITTDPSYFRGDIYDFIDYYQGTGGTSDTELFGNSRDWFLLSIFDNTPQVTDDGQGTIKETATGQINWYTLGNPAPDIPGLTAAPSGNDVYLTWNDVADEDGYEFGWSQDNTNWNTFTQTAPVGSTSITLPYKDWCGDTYFRIRAYDDIYGGSWSAGVVATMTPSCPTPTITPTPTLTPTPTPSVPPTAPGNVRYSDVTETSFKLNWNDSQSEDNYLIENRNNTGGSWEEIGTAGANVVNFTVTGLTCDMRDFHYYRVKAVNMIGESIGELPISPPNWIYLAPCAPSDLSATAISGAEIRLSWMDNSETEDEHNVERSIDQINWTGVFNQMGYYGKGEHEAIDSTDIQIGTTYYYRAYCKRWSGNVSSGYSNIASVIAGSTGTPTPTRTPTPAQISTPTPTRTPTPTPCPGKTKGNANGDCYINNADYTIWLCEYLNNGVCPNPASNKQADFNSDSKVDLIDFEIWRTNKQ